MINKWKKLEVFCIFGISTHLSFLGSIFSFFFFIFHFFIICFSYFDHTLSIFHHFYSFLIMFFVFFIDFLCFAAFSTKKLGKSDEHLAKSKDSEHRTEKWKKHDKEMKNKWKKLEVFCIFGISTHLSFLGASFSLFFHLFFHFFVICFSYFYRTLSIFHHFYPFLIMFFVFFIDFLCFAAFSTKKLGKSDEHLAKSKESEHRTEKWKKHDKKNQK